MSAAGDKNGAFSGTSYVDIAQLEEWFAGAAAAAKCIYATGPALDPRNPVKQLIDEWLRTGEALPLPQMRLGPGLFRYSFQRARPSRRAAPDEKQRTRVTVDADWRETEKGRVFMFLVRAANRGLPCPTNASLAEVAGLRDADAARYQMRLLRDEGRIEVVLSGAGRSFRRVRIMETGRWTADEPGGGALPGLAMEGYAT